MAGVLALGLCAPTGLSAQTLNLYGNPGLIDLPSGQNLPDGEAALTYGWFPGTQRTNVHFQLLPRVSGTLRVSSIDDAPGAPLRSDRGFDLKFQLLEESDRLPGVAVGFRDVLGDGPYSAEYVVATKTLPYGVSLTGGIGWGRLGGVGDIGSPLGERGPLTDPTGRPQIDSYFQGPAAFFGGVEWDTGFKGVHLKAEYSSDAYEDESFARNSPFNFGIAWKPNDNLQVSASYMYGNEIGLQLTLRGNPMKPLVPQDLGTGPSPVRARPEDAPRGTGWATAEAQDQLVKALAEVLATERIVIEEARFGGEKVELYVDNTSITREPKAIGRIARILSLAMPASVEVFEITLVSNGLPVTTAILQRTDIEAQVDRPEAGLLSSQTTKLRNARARIEGDGVYRRPIDPRFTWGFSPTLPLNLLDADDGFQPDILLSAVAHYQFTRGLSLTAEFSRFLIGTDQETVSTSTSPLPRVRSDSDLYYSGRDVEIERLSADYVFKLSPDVYGRTSAGILERVFTGVSTEVLFAPVDSPFAVGAEVNYVRQRDFNDPFALTDYDVVTGHGSIYWDTGWRGIEAQLDAGRYLAGDWGATLSLERRFDNGWSVRAYATGTDVSFADFGEGSFAKGVEVSIPLRWGVPFETKSRARVDLVPVENDGGARLAVKGRLYDRVRDLDRTTLRDGWDSFWQ